MSTPGSARLHLHEVAPDSMGESISLGPVRLVVSPGAGRLRHVPPAQFHEGHEWVTRGQPVALLDRAGGAVEVRSPVEGRVTGFLVRDGEPVQPGQPIASLDEGVRRPGPGPVGAR